MGKFIDMTGQRFGRLVVLERDYEAQAKTTQSASFWKCKCDCGNIVSVNGTKLRNGHTQSCGCLKKELLSKRAEDLTGQVFGYYTVIEKSDKKTSSGGILWKCKCTCGNIRYISTNALKAGIQKSCGCMKGKLLSESRTEDLTGQVFHFLTVLKKADNQNTSHTKWLCKCKCGNTCEVEGIHLKSGHTTSCGCKHNSIGEQNIIDFLNKNNYNFLFDSTYFKDLILPSGYIGRYDFIIFDENNKKPVCIIEFDGLQHTQEWSRSDTTLEQRKIYDKIKNDYAKNHNLPLYRIPYTERDNITKETLFNPKYLIK